MAMVDVDAVIRAALPDPHEALTFRLRWDRWSPQVAECLTRVYSERADALLARLLDLALAAAAARPADLRRLDEARLLTPDWLQSQEMIGYVAYTDRFAGTLQGVRERLDYLSGLGVTYLHLMPLLKPRPGENDGGYAVADYRDVREDLGSIDDLAQLASDLRGRGISLVLDLVLNHVAREHEWAERARRGEARYRDYFHIHPDRRVPDSFEKSLPDVFPDFAPGNFTWDAEARGWVWTTFNAWQWDLNWANPDVFAEFADIIFFLANVGVEVVRLDAIAFIWKELGTDCQNEPPVHDLTQALRAMARIVAPALAFKAEAIVSPTDLVAYLGRGRHHGLVSDMAYHNSVMVQAWSAIAARDTTLMQAALSAFPPKPTTTTWGIYMRCHDDIGWAVSDEDAAAAQLDGHAHRRFLSDFYSGNHPGSFAKGMVFQENADTGDRRISGTLASLAGLERAIGHGDRWMLLDAVARIKMLLTLELGFGGVPLLYMGDELAMLNDYTFRKDPAHAADNRWVHRPKMDWQLVDRVAAAEIRHPAERIDPATMEIVARAWVNAHLRRIIEVRKALPQLHASVESEVIPSPDRRLLLLRRRHPLGRMVGVYNVSEDYVRLANDVLRPEVGAAPLEAISGYTYDLTPPHLTLERYQSLWLVEPVEG